MPEVRRIEPEALPAYRAHLERHFGESGDGEPPFAPYALGATLDLETWQSRAALQLHLPVSIPTWKRAWGLVDGDTVVGHVELNGADLEVDLHRARLGVGVERSQRGGGHGRALMQAAISWARGREELAWIDLVVFEHNQVAVKLYDKLGFARTGRVEDRHRIDGRQVHEVMMSLRVC